MTGRRRIGALVATLFLLGACSRGGGPPDVPVEDAPPFTYVAVGASETVGVGARDPGVGGWTHVLHRRGLGRGATFVNVGISGSTVAAALDQQLDRALDEEPDLVTVWLNVNDLVRMVPVERYEADLGVVVRSLRRGGATQVVVANTPPLEDLPVVKACLPNPPPGSRCLLPVPLPGVEPVLTMVGRYNEAIARVVEREGAVLADLHAAGTAARGRGLEGFYSADGFHPSDEGHAAIADAVADFIRTDRRTSRFAASTTPVSRSTPAAD